MKLYNILTKKDQSDKVIDFVLLKEGFSFMAFCFNLFWFLFHKMWRFALAIFVLNLILQYFMQSEIISKNESLFLEFIFIALISYNANAWYLEHLLKKGYKIDDFILAANEEEAKIKAGRAVIEKYPDFIYKI